MSLSDRKIKILHAIVNDYIATAEPIGSRTIAKKYDFGLSSATIRNEMSDLEEMGFIIQPHTSSGRIPSDLGYRLYVDSLMQKDELEEGERDFLQNMANANINKIENLMEETAKILSALTNYTTIITDSVNKKKKIKKIQFMSLDNKSVNIIIASDKNKIENYLAKVEYLPDDDELHNLSQIISVILKDQPMDNVDEKAVEELNDTLAGQGELVSAVLKAIDNASRGKEQTQFHLSGAKNILTFPEFSDVSKAKTLMQTLEEKETIKNIISNPKSENGDVQIYIGNETGIEEMKDCSIITTSYKFADDIEGNIAILGPTRMNYSQVVSVLNGMVKNIESAVKRINNNKEDTKNDS